jgi:hypothetical protein
MPRRQRHAPSLPPILRLCEGDIQVEFGARLENVDRLQPKGMGRCLCIARLARDNALVIVRVDEHGDDGRRGKQLV